jgi:Phytanoyl-CoA dioxygenase (PhyH)
MTVPAGTTRLTGEERAQFEKEGYLFPIRVLSERETEQYLANFMDYCSQNQARLEVLPPKDRYQVFSATHFLLPWVYEIVSHPRVLDAVEGLLGPNLLVWATDWFAKMPGEKTYYWNLRPANVVTAWVALSPSTPANGGMQVIPGTHKRPALPQRETYALENALSRGQEIEVEMDEGRAVNMDLRPGEMSLHHIWIVHGSHVNTSSIPRIGIAAYALSHRTSFRTALGAHWLCWCEVRMIAGISKWSHPLQMGKASPRRLTPRSLGDFMRVL